MRIKILAMSYLFPNRANPDYGIFVLNRLKAINGQADLKIINPIPWSPFHRFMGKYRGYENIPAKDNIGGLEVYHPRFLSIPKYFKSVESITYYLAVAPIVKKINEESGFDIVDLHWTYPDLPAGVRLAGKYKKKLLVTLRGKEAFHFQDADLRKTIVKWCLKRVDNVVALSSELKSMYETTTGLCGRTDVVRNGVDTSRFSFATMEDSRKKLGLDARDKIIVSVGSLTYGKGFDLLIKAVSIIIEKSKFENLKLYIIGSEGHAGDFRKQLHQLVMDRGLSDCVVFMGQVPNDSLSVWYNAADLFCLASRSEGSPNVLTEALACGCPAVATDVGSVREILESEDDIGVCVKPDCDAALATGLSAVFSQIDAKVKQVPMGVQNARQKKSGEFQGYDWAWCGRNVMDIYRKMLDQ